MVVFPVGMVSAHSIDFMTHSLDAPAGATATTGISGPEFPYLPRTSRDRITVTGRTPRASAGLSFLLGLGFNQLVLLFVQRVRPYDAQITHLIIDRSADFSFPSDHATASFAIAAAFLLHGLPKRGFVFLAAAVLLAVSRVYIGTHYVGDVLGGAVTGIVAAFVVWAAYREGSKLDRLVSSIL
jgi:membrane-associated phospholipid phosphatase